jgi:hypothetical protein
MNLAPFGRAIKLLSSSAYQPISLSAYQLISLSAKRYEPLYCIAN